jgi:hypothetical protein
MERETADSRTISATATRLNILKGLCNRMTATLFMISCGQVSSPDSKRCFRVENHNQERYVIMLEFAS